MATAAHSNVIQLNTRAGGSGSIVLAWRDDKKRATLSSLMRRAGFAVYEAASSEEVLEHFDEHEAGMIVCEYDLGDEDAIWLLKKLSFTRVNLPRISTIMVGRPYFNSDHERLQYLNIKAILPESATDEMIVATASLHAENAATASVTPS